MPNRRGRERTEPKQVTAVEKQIGARIGAFRKMKGMSQGALGEAVGVTFQQIQKYEKGMNRASAGRLQQMAAVLEVPLSAFFDDVGGEDGPAPGEALTELREPGAAELLRIYTSISSGELRRSLLQIARELASAASKTAGPVLAKCRDEPRVGHEKQPDSSGVGQLGAHLCVRCLPPRAGTVGAGLACLTTGRLRLSSGACRDVRQARLRAV
jgi:transcriptional regulator with XRE-family HTH domain